MIERRELLTDAFLSITLHPARGTHWQPELIRARCLVSRSLGIREIWRANAHYPEGVYG